MKKLSIVYLWPCFILTFVWDVIPIFRWGTWGKTSGVGDLSKITELRKSLKSRKGGRYRGCQREARQGHSKPHMFSTDKTKISKIKHFHERGSKNFSSLRQTIFSKYALKFVTRKFWKQKLGVFLSFWGAIAVRNKSMFMSSRHSCALQTLAP